MGIDAELLAVVSLDAERAKDPAVTGAKAANLARAAAAGLPVLPGFALVPAGRAEGAPTGAEALRRAWRELTGVDDEDRDDGQKGQRGQHGKGGRPLAVRSSSAHEDTVQSSMAGRFETVLDVRGWEDFTAAVRTVLDSARRVQVLHPPEGRDADPLDGMAVLVQPMLRAAVGGVMFGADPVGGREDRLLISAVSGGPHQLVDGSTQGVRYQLSRYGRVLATDPAEPPSARLLGRRRIGRLVRLARTAHRVFGGPQDIEFGFADDGRLWLFQSRPITAMAVRPPRGARLLGPGPVAETLPGVLQPLEEDLWVAPMSHGLTVALDLAGAAPRRRLRALPAVTTVGGRVAADLHLLGAVPSAHPAWDFLNPAAGSRRVSAAWRMGRLRSALPLLAQDLMADVDRQLMDTPAPREMIGGRLLDAVSWGRAVLSSLHAQESLAGGLLDHDYGATAAGEALAQLAECRARGRDDAELLARHPVLLTLLPPALGARAALPQSTGWTGVPRGVGALPVREGLRLRIRWVQEMQAEMIRELSGRLRAGDEPLGLSRLVLLRWEELVRAADGGALPRDLSGRRPRPDVPALPASFRLADGFPVAEAPAGGGRTGAGQGAGGGFGTGIVWDGHGARPEHAVLVVRALDPALAPLLPGLAGLVAETSSVLSHLAILARERGVPAAVGVPGALDRFPPGTAVSVDGTTGAVERTGAVAPSPPTSPAAPAQGRGAAA